jgi:hypothetical protein
MNISEYLSWLIYHETLTFGLHCLVREKKIKNKYVFSQRIKYYNSTIVDQYFLAKFIWSILNKEKIFQKSNTNTTWHQRLIWK